MENQRNIDLPNNIFQDVNPDLRGNILWINTVSCTNTKS